MDHNELYALNREYVQAALDESRLLHRPGHVIDTLAALYVRHETGFRAGGDGYLVLDDEGRECRPRVTVADLGDAYSMEVIEQRIRENRKALLALHSDLMAVHSGIGGEGDGGAANEFIYTPATPASERMRTSETVSEVPPDPEADSQPPATVESPGLTFDEVVAEYNARDHHRDAVESVAETFANMGYVAAGQRIVRELDHGWTADALRALDEPGEAERQAANENTSIEQSAHIHDRRTDVGDDRPVEPNTPDDTDPVDTQPSEHETTLESSKPEAPTPGRPLPPFPTPDSPEERRRVETEGQRHRRRVRRIPEFDDSAHKQDHEAGNDEPSL